MTDFEDKVKEKLEDVRPALQEDGGDVKFVKSEGKTVFLELQGACAGCPMAQMTLKNGIENYLRENLDKDIVVEPAE